MWIFVGVTIGALLWLFATLPFLGWLASTTIFLAIVAAVLTALVSFVKVPANRYLQVTWSFFLSPRPKPGHFIVPQWHQGIWAKIFGPGWRWIWFVRLFGRRQLREFTEIKPDTYGLIEALDGEVPSPERRQVVSSKEEITYETITDGQEFLKRGGEKGYQLVILYPGIHIINRELFRVGLDQKVVEIAPGKVGVIIASVGEDPTEDDLIPVGHNVHGQAISILKPEIKEEKRGIRSEILLPGKHLVNRQAYRVEIVDVTPTRVVLDGRTETTLGGNRITLGAPEVTTKDGFSFPMNGEVVIQVQPVNAPKVIAFGGTLAEFIQDIVVPYIDDISKTTVSERPLAEFFGERKKIRDFIEIAIRTALEGPDEARSALSPEQLSTEEAKKDAEEAIAHGRRLDVREYYPIKVNTFRILQLNFETLGGPVQQFVQVRTREATANQEVATVHAETKVAEERIKLAEQQATADEQPNLIRAQFQAKAAEPLEKSITIIKKSLAGTPVEALTPFVPSLIQLVDAVSDRIRGVGSTTTPK